MRVRLGRPVRAHLHKDATVAADAIYGTVLVTAVIAGATLHDEPALRVLIVSGVSVLVFWASHVYASVLAQHMAGDHAMGTEIRSAAAHHRGMLQASVAPLVILGFGALRLIDDDRAAALAMWSGVVILQVVGTISIRRRGGGWWASLGAGFGAASLGLVLILLKSVLH